MQAQPLYNFTMHIIFLEWKLMENIEFVIDFVG